MKNFVKEGRMMPYTPSGAPVASGAFVQVGTIIGVASGLIPDGEEGELMVVGVFECPNPDSVAIAQGAAVGYDAAANKITAGGAGDYNIGTAHEAIPASTAPGKVLLPLGPA
jgi:predicted RecA/RadA family phage recombinase